LTCLRPPDAPVVPAPQDQSVINRPLQERQQLLREAIRPAPPQGYPVGVLQPPTGWIPSSFTLRRKPGQVLLEAVPLAEKQGLSERFGTFSCISMDLNRSQLSQRQFAACGASIRCRALRQTDHLLTWSTLLLQAT
jgi:hypothetical protein